MIAGIPDIARCMDAGNVAGNLDRFFFVFDFEGCEGEGYKDRL